MRRIEIPMPPADLPGRVVEVPVLVDWFPRLTEDQILANALAALDGAPPPFPDPNLVCVRLTR